MMIVSSGNHSAVRRDPGESLHDYQSALIQAYINDKMPQSPCLLDPFGEEDDAMARDITDWLAIASLQRILHDKANMKRREELWRSIRAGAIVVRTAWGVAIRVEAA